jgi:hypothetical protein
MEEMLSIKVRDDGVIIVRESIDNEIIGAIAGKRLTNAELIAALHQFVLHYDLDKKTNERLETYYDETAPVASNSEGSIIRLRWTNNPYMEWVWDGKILKPRWGMRQEDEWEFDGKYLKPVWGYAAQSEWSWDGSILKKFWSNDTKDQWIWDGQMLRPYWESDSKKEWSFDGEIFKPYWHSDPQREWEVIGEIPIPVIAIVVFGVADR